MEKLKDVTEDQKKFAVDTMIALVVEELVYDMKLEPTAALKDFVTSKTGSLLYDESSKLWWNGPSYYSGYVQKRNRNGCLTLKSKSKRNILVIYQEKFEIKFVYF